MSLGLPSLLRYVGHVLQLHDATGAQSFDDPDWVDGGQTPLHKDLHRAINRRSPTMMASLTQVLDGFCSAMDTDSANGCGDPEILRSLERRLTGYFDHTTQASAIQRLSSFGSDPTIGVG